MTLMTSDEFARSVYTNHSMTRALATVEANQWFRFFDGFPAVLPVCSYEWRGERLMRLARWLDECISITEIAQPSKIQVDGITWWTAPTHAERTARLTALFRKPGIPAIEVAHSLGGWSVLKDLFDAHEFAPCL